MPKNGLEFEFQESDWCTTLVIKHNGKVVFEMCDHPEPEDATWSRDLGYLVSFIEQAYALGFKDGQEAAKDAKGE